MATRIQEVKECDRAMCRRRKDVAEYALVLSRGGIAENGAAGELCPAHAKMAKRFIDDLFNNKKEYDDAPEPTDPTNRTE